VDGIRDALRGFAALRPMLTGEIQAVVETADTALVTNRWTLVGTRPDGSPVEMGGVSADVVRRQLDGSWRILIDDPWGGGAPG
jgi:ketosteroid isomerase-like protein